MADARPALPDKGLKPLVNRVWLPIRKAADLFDTYPQAIRRRLNEFDHRRVPGLGGAQAERIEIALDSLPEDQQRQYYREQTGEPAHPLLTTVETDLALADLDVRENVPPWAREKADRKLAAIREFRSFLSEAREKTRLGKTAALALFCEARADLSKSSLHRWLRAYERDGYAGLVDNYGNRGGYELLTDTDKAEIRAARRKRQNVRQTWERVAKLAKAEGRPQPSYSTVAVYFRSPECRLSVDYHDGPKTFERNWHPHRRMDYEDLRPLDVAVADNYRYKCWCTILQQIAPGHYRQKMIRPWLSWYLDAKARIDLGHDVCVKPNTLSIRRAFRQMVVEFGVPRKVKHDWGRDFTAKYFIRGQYHPKFPYSVDAEIEGVLSVLESTFGATEPYHGASKNIEPVHGRIQQEFDKDWPSYCGAGPEDRPEACDRLLAAAQKEIDEKGSTTLLPTFEEFRAAFDRWLVIFWRTHPLDTRAHGSHGRSPLQIWNEEKDDRPVKRIPVDKLRFLLMDRAPATVQRDGIEKFNAFYWSDDLPITGTKVVVAWDPDDLSQLFVSNKRGEPLCLAVRDPRASQLPGGQGQHKEFGHRRKKMNKLAQQLDGERRAYRHEVMAAHEALIPDPSDPAQAPAPESPQVATTTFANKHIAAADVFQQKLEQRQAVNDFSIPDPDHNDLLDDVYQVAKSRPKTESTDDDWADLYVPPASPIKED